MKEHFAFVFKMLRSIVSPYGDFYILLVALWTGIILLLILKKINDINKSFDKMASNPDWAIDFRNKLNSNYTLFTTLITLFPLFGMLGTVIALLNLNLSGEITSMDSIKTNFFNALTSTAWGLIFSIFFKLLNAKIIPDVKDTMLKLQKKIEDNKTNRINVTAKAVR